MAGVAAPGARRELPRRASRALVERAILAFLLPGVAGAINASGFFAVGTYTSHMTGMVARIGDELATSHLGLAARALAFVLSFIGGAMLATGLILHARRVSRAFYWRPLLLECALLLVFATVNVGSEHGAQLDSLEMTALLCFAMGLQNALVTKLSGSVVRTTHLTGVTTDIGIEAMRALDGWWHSGRRPSLRKDAALAPLRRHLAIWGSFFTGALIGPVLYLRIGHIAMLVPCAVLAAPGRVRPLVRHHRAIVHPRTGRPGANVSHLTDVPGNGGPTAIRRCPTPSPSARWAGSSTA